MAFGREQALYGLALDPGVVVAHHPGHWDGQGGHVVFQIVQQGDFVLEDIATHRAFYVYDLHLDSLGTSRQKSAVLLCDRIAARNPRDPAFVVGDFNAPEREATSRYLRGEVELETSEGRRRVPKAWADSFRVLHPDATDIGTGNSFRGLKTGKKIDYIYVARGTEVVAASVDHYNVDGAYPSDHFPVTATVVLSH